MPYQFSRYVQTGSIHDMMNSGSVIIYDSLPLDSKRESRKFIFSINGFQFYTIFRTIVSSVLISFASLYFQSTGLGFHTIFRIIVSNVLISFKLLSTSQQNVSCRAVENNKIVGRRKNAIRFSSIIRSLELEPYF